MTPLNAKAADLIERGGGASAVGRAVGVTKQAVLKWRKKGIPEDRLPAVMAHIAMRSGNRRVTGNVIALDVGLPAVEQPSGPARAARKPEDAAAIKIARRDLEIAKRRADVAEKAAAGRPPVMPLSASYWLLLAMIAAIEIPVMSGSILALSGVVPITAYCSAAGAVIFLIAGTHIIGGPLREFGDRMPRWIPSLANLMTWALVIGGLSFLALDLRATGMEAEAVVSAGNMMFPTPGQAGRAAPIAAMVALIKISAAVMVAGTLLAIVLSYVRHGPQAEFARAESAYRRALHAIERIDQCP